MRAESAQEAPQRLRFSACRAGTRLRSPGAKIRFHGRFRRVLERLVRTPAETGSFSGRQVMFRPETGADQIKLAMRDARLPSQPLAAVVSFGECRSVVLALRSMVRRDA